MRNQRGFASAIGNLFGGLWAFVAAMALPAGWRLPTALMATLTTALLIFRLFRARSRVSDSGERLFSRRAYLIAVIAEILAIYVASAVLPRFGWQGFMLQAVGVIVGLHFIGLWLATRSIRFLGIAAGMCVVSAVAVVLPAAVHEMNMRDFFTGCGNALVLWVGAAGTRARPR